MTKALDVMVASQNNEPVEATQLPHLVHVVGIGGAGMAALAEILLGLGCQITGSDLKENSRTQRLGELGIQVFIGHHPDNIQAAEAVIYSTAIPPENVELRAAQAAGIQVWNRAALLRRLSALKSIVAVAGTHGKTTTASMLSLILLHARFNPSFIIGGDVNEVGSGACWNTGEYFVVEADESDGSFLALNPAHAVITSIDPDHHTRYESFEALCHEFLSFLNLARNTAVVHTEALASLEPYISTLKTGQLISYGTQPESDYQIVDFLQAGTSTSFKVLHNDEIWTELSLPVPGLHNAENALAALLTAQSVGVSAEAARESLMRFAGIARRFEFRGTAHNVTFVDDYAHLPAEVSAAIATATALENQRVVCVFQPHRFSRIKNLWQDFSHSFKGVTTLVVTDIYSAGEMPLPGVTGELIAQAVKNANSGMDVRWAPRLDDVVDLLRQELQAGDLCLTLGAGDIHLVIDQLKEATPQWNELPPSTSQDPAGPAPASSQKSQDALEVEYFKAKYEELTELLPSSEVMADWPLGKHTSYRVGGSASLAVKLNSHAELAQLAAFLAAQSPELPVLVLGNGTNLLISDTGFQGLVVQLGQKFSAVEFSAGTGVGQGSVGADDSWDNSPDMALLRLGAAGSLPVAARQSAAAGLGGFEWAVGVPGSVGGAIKMNAGGHGADISQSLRSAICVDLRTGLFQTLRTEDLRLGYRSSALDPEQIVCEASFELAPSDPNQSKQLIAEILRWRRQHQPGGQNCGSVFANPKGEAAGALIDQLGLKGKKLGTASVSAKHANFIIAGKDGSADDVLRLMCEIAEVVKAKTGIQLKSETVLVGFDHLNEKINLKAINR